MAITINGTGTITGISAGGLPDGVITSADLASGAITATGLPTGSILQVAQGYKTDTYSNSTATYTDISDLSVTLTPSSVNSRFLIIVNLHLYSTFYRGDVRLLRGTTEIGQANVANNRPRAFIPYGNGQNDTADGSNMFASNSFLDDPNLSNTNDITYKLQGRGRVDTATYTNTFYINRSHNDRDNTAYDARGTSSIVVMEIA